MVMEPLGGGVFLEEVCHWRWALGLCSLDQLPVVDLGFLGDLELLNFWNWSSNIYIYSQLRNLYPSVEDFPRSAMPVHMMCGHRLDWNWSKGCQPYKDSLDRCSWAVQESWQAWTCEWARGWANKLHSSQRNPHGFCFLFLLKFLPPVKDTNMVADGK